MAVKPDEKQPQVVTSPDGKLQIINHYSYNDHLGCHVMEGTVKYLSPEPNLAAEIKIDYYTMDGEFIDTEVDTVALHESGRTRAFEIMYSGERRRDIKYYRLYITAKKKS